MEASDRLSLDIVGPFGAMLTGEADNLILKALRALGEAAGIGAPLVRVTLDKRLPIAAGLGGGSSDAGAALRLTDRLLGLDLGEDRLSAVSRVVGADGPMCLSVRPAWAEGIGERLTPEPRLPPLHAVLVNPGRPSPTGAVYRAYDAGPARTAERPEPPERWSSADVIDWLAAQRNDLQVPAIDLEPAIGEALAAVASTGARLTRMSGSGATVFGLFDTASRAASAVEALGRVQPAWWIQQAMLGDHRDETAQ